MQPEKFANGTKADKSKQTSLKADLQWSVTKIRNDLHASINCKRNESRQFETNIGKGRSAMICNEDPQQSSCIKKLQTKRMQTNRNKHRQIHPACMRTAEWSNPQPGTEGCTISRQKQGEINDTLCFHNFLRQIARKGQIFRIHLDCYIPCT